MRALFVAAFLAALPAHAQVILDVHVYNFDFSTNPQGGPIVDPVINVGDTIRWIFDSGTHNVRSVIGAPESFYSGNPGTVATYEYTFTEVGVNWYYCEPHGVDLLNGTADGMSGTITVVPEPGTWATVLGGCALAGALIQRSRRLRAGPMWGRSPTCR